MQVKYLGVAFTSDGWQNKELGIPIGKAITIMKALHYSVVMKRFSSCETKIVNNEAKLLIFVLCPFLSTLSLYGHENSVMIERVRMQVQASKMRFLKKIKGVTSLTRCTSLKIRKSLELLLLQIKRSQT